MPVDAHDLALQPRRAARLLAALILAAGVIGFPAECGPLALCPAHAQCRHVYDAAGALPPADVPRFEDYMRWIQRESDVDIRFVFVAGTGERTIEALAADVVDQLKIGGRTGQARGLLLLYDVRGRRLKVEVGYGLEGYFPDAFVSYLVNEHARQFFESGDASLGLRLMLRLLQARIRDAVLGNDFDPRVVEAVRSHDHLSGGAGVTAAMPAAPNAPARRAGIPGDPELAFFSAGNTPEQTYAAYLAWLAQPRFEANVDIFTQPSRAYLARLPLSPAYRQFILFGEYGKAYRVVERGGLALLYFTGTPFVSPHFLVKEGNVWRMDTIAEVRDTRERVGGAYTWDYRGAGDPYTRAFSDLLVDVRGYRRIKGGDNRPLVVRGP